jgi:hypothetical protein
MKDISTQSTIGLRPREQGTAIGTARNPIWERWVEMASHLNRARYQHVMSQGIEQPGRSKEWSTCAYLPPPVEWLPVVERRIKASIVPEEYEDDHVLACRSGEWLHEDVARSALDFFGRAGDLLPGEPYIYSSRSGNLVAEFCVGTAPLTTVISPETVTILMVEDDVPVETNVKRLSNSLREKLKELKARISE